MQRACAWSTRGLPRAAGGSASPGLGRNASRLQRRDRSPGDRRVAGGDGFHLVRLLLVELAQLVERPRRRAAAALERLVELGRQVEQRQVVRDGRLVDPHPPGDLGVRFARIDARAHEPGEVDRRQAVTLLVLGDLGVGVVGLLSR